ncbi:MAG: AraC family transcriptional regulator [Clostridia bacterium]|nr:AraC family transcriptional regulator [Clostridia bacterium]
MENIFRETKSSISFFLCDTPDYPAHIHDDIELVFTVSGAGTAFCDGKRYEVKPNSFFIAFPNQVHHYTDFSEGVYIVLIIKPSRLFSFTNVFLEGVPTSALCQFDENEGEDITGLLKSALKEQEKEAESPIVTALITAVFGKLLRFYHIEKSKVSKNSVLQILEYCANHYKEEISVESVAKALKISRSCVSHVFSKRICINFCDYINSLRLGNAVGLLKSKSYSVTEIADMSGFPSVRTFNRAFRKRYGSSPSEYRRVAEARADK